MLKLLVTTCICNILPLPLPLLLTAQHIQSMGAQIGTRSDSDALRERMYVCLYVCLSVCIDSVHMRMSVTAFFFFLTLQSWHIEKLLG